MVASFDEHSPHSSQHDCWSVLFPRFGVTMWFLKFKTQITNRLHQVKRSRLESPSTSARPRETQVDLTDSKQMQAAPQEEARAQNRIKSIPETYGNPLDL